MSGFPPDADLPEDGLTATPLATSVASLSEHRYQQMFSIVLEKSEQHESNIACLRHHLPLALRRLNKPTTKRQPFRALSIGSGMGQIDLEILQIITQYYSQSTSGKVNIFNRAIEPNVYMLGKYKESIEHLPHSLITEANIKFDLQQVSFQEYAHELEQVHGCKFDMVHFIHSIYYVDVESALLYCYNEVLGYKGVIVCIVQNREDLIFKTYDKLKELRRDLGPITSTICNEDVMKVANKEKWLVEEHRFEFDFDITEIFKKNCTEGDLLIDAVTQRMNFRSVVDKEMVKKVEGIIDDLSWPEDGRKVAKLADDLIIIFKGC